MITEAQKLLQLKQLERYGKIITVVLVIGGLVYVYEKYLSILNKMQESKINKYQLLKYHNEFPEEKI